ncbi:ABC transporter permease [Clostridium kluyveri]|uniref:ABC3 transporter permease C-terminal domain-containing protein n=1 Tax=Clostridium kluyveri TaxID=1534 RepID=A0A1L5FCW5_CLOKL|nr:ABC transporter permease [Clostridium kluyveri]APM40660.1 hypothetical protein BS101_18975 [Clostridium kluyveri]
MFQNNNNAVVKKLTKRMVHTNKSRNIYVIAAVTLTALLITFIFSIGMSFLKSYKIQQVRLMGTEAHAAVTRVTDDQIKKLKSLDYVKIVGLQSYVAGVKNTSKMKNMSASLYWYDKTEWEQFRVPTNTNVVGNYPKKYNEIMVPLWMLENMGVKNPTIGMKMPLDFSVNTEDNKFESQTFVLSGYFKDYVNIRSGNTDVMLVSKEFAEKNGMSVKENGAASVIYKDSKNINKYNKQLVKDLSIAGNQKIKTSPIYDETNNEDLPYTLLAFGIIICFIMFTGYLLIYNVLYISISKDTRFYGLLKTIGTTPRQLSNIVKGQALRLSAVGIPLGLVFGAILSFLAVPMALSTVDLDTGVEISFNPLIFIGGAFFALITTLIGAYKPAKIAGKITPIESMNYTGINLKGKIKRSVDGGKLYKMAWRNIFRNRKRAFIVFISLFLGITTFMTVTCLISSMNMDNFIASYVKNDFILENNTLSIGTTGEKKQKFNKDFFKKIKSIEGITALHTTSLEGMHMKYSPEQFEKHVKWFMKRFNIKENTTEKNIQQVFFGYIIGIDSSYIEEFNKGRKKPIDVEAFERGEFALIGTDNPEIYSGVNEMDVTIESTKTSLKIPLGGFIPWGFQYAGGGMAPNIYMSNKALEKLAANPFVYKVNIDVEDNFEKQALEKIKSLTDNDHEITRISKIEQQEMMHDAKITMYILGGGVTLILALIGVLNFVNVMSTGIMVRRHEFAIMESLGMTKKQMRKMLRFEGILYAGMTTVLVGLFGSVITFGLFKLFQQQADYAVFSYPYLQLLCSIIIIFFICVITPEIQYRVSTRCSVVERLREIE